MKKGIARLGFIALLVLFTNPGHAYSVSDLLISEVMASQIGITDPADKRFNRYNSNSQKINLLDNWLRDDALDLHRFDTDLLILPEHQQAFAQGSNHGFGTDSGCDQFMLGNEDDVLTLWWEACPE